MGLGCHERVYQVVERIPRGRVATYGQIAAMLGDPRGARQVGYALAALGRGRPRPQVPWHRVVNAQGRANLGQEQRMRLETEGVVFDVAGRADLGQYGWDGVDAR